MNIKFHEGLKEYYCVNNIRMYTPNPTKYIREHQKMGDEVVIGVGDTSDERD